MKIIGYGRIEQRRAYTGDNLLPKRIRINPNSIGKKSRYHSGIGELLTEFEPGDRIKITLESASKEEYREQVYFQQNKVKQ